MTVKKDYIKEVESKLKELLCEISAISIKKTRLNTKLSPVFQADLVLEIFFINKKKNIVVEIITVGEPRYIRSAVHQLASYLARRVEDYGVIAAPYISEKTGQICKEANIGYIDLSGNCYLSFDSIYIKKENYKSIDARKKEVKSLFAKKLLDS